MKAKVFLVIGCPGSGKTWVCEQLKSLVPFVPHDNFKNSDDYVSAICLAINTKKVVLAETPFSISRIKEPLKSAGIEVVPVFIQEPHHVLQLRYWKREGKDIPAGHLTRQQTYLKRAKEYGAFVGTSEQVLQYLKRILYDTNTAR
jgi:hypothetical protein